MSASHATAIERPEGWTAVFAGAIGLMMSFGSIAVYTFTVFLKPLTDQFGGSRGAVSFAFTAACLAALGSILVVGRLVDRVGGRPVAIVATTLFGIGFAALSLISSHIWQLYAVFLFLGLVGAGTAAIPYSSVISHWFDARRGLALGLTMAGLGIGSAAVPTVAQALIDLIGWRAAYVAFGGVVVLIASPVLLLWFREPGRIVGTPASMARNAVTVELHGASTAEARRAPTLWLMLAALLLMSAAAQGCLIHLVPLLTDAGVTPERAALSASLFGVANLLGRLTGGYLLDRVFAPYVVVGSLLGAGLGICLLLVGPRWAFVAAVLMGLSAGAETDAIPYLVSRYFGLRSFGQIYSYLFLTVPLGGAVGPLLVGIGFDSTGSYTIPLACCALAMLVGAFMLTRLGPYPDWMSHRSGWNAPAATLAPSFTVDGD